MIFPPFIRGFLVLALCVSPLFTGHLAFAESRQLRIASARTAIDAYYSDPTSRVNESGAMTVIHNFSLAPTGLGPSEFPGFTNLEYDFLFGVLEDSRDEFVPSQLVAEAVRCLLVATWSESVPMAQQPFYEHLLGRLKRFEREGVVQGAPLNEFLFLALATFPISGNYREGFTKSLAHFFAQDNPELHQNQFDYWTMRAKVARDGSLTFQSLNARELRKFLQENISNQRLTPWVSYTPLDRSLLNLLKYDFSKKPEPVLERLEYHSTLSRALYSPVPLTRVLVFEFVEKAIQEKIPGILSDELLTQVLGANEYMEAIGEVESPSVHRKWRKVSNLILELSPKSKIRTDFEVQLEQIFVKTFNQVRAKMWDSTDPEVRMKAPQVMAVAALAGFLEALSQIREPSVVFASVGFFERVALQFPFRFQGLFGAPWNGFKQLLNDLVAPDDFIEAAQARAQVLDRGIMRLRCALILGDATTVANDDGPLSGNNR